MSKMKVEDVERVDPVLCVGNPDEIRYGAAESPSVFDFFRGNPWNGRDEPDVMRFELTCTECETRSVVIVTGSLGLAPHCSFCGSNSFNVNYLSETDSNLPLNELIN